MEVQRCANSVCAAPPHPWFSKPAERLSDISERAEIQSLDQGNDVISSYPQWIFKLSSRWKLQ